MMVQWLKQGTANFQVVGMNLDQISVCGICFPNESPFVSGLTNIEAKHLKNSIQLYTLL